MLTKIVGFLGRLIEELLNGPAEWEHSFRATVDVPRLESQLDEQLWTSRLADERERRVEKSNPGKQVLRVDSRRLKLCRHSPSQEESLSGLFCKPLKHGLLRGTNPTL